MKKLVSLASAVMANLGLVRADGVCSMMWGESSMMSSGFAGIYGVVLFAVFAFLFSVIFWLTYKWVTEGRKRR